MKGRLSGLLAAAAAAAVLLAGCEEKQVEDPVLTVVSESEINVPAEGGAYGIAYEVENPTPDGRVLADAKGYGWITGIDTGNPDSVLFTVEKNDSQQPREGTVTLRYEYHPAGSPAMDLSVSFAEVAVFQEGNGDVPAPDPDYSNAFTITTDGIGATTARMAVTCKYPELYWTAGILTKADYDMYVDGNELEMQSYLNALLQDVALSYGYTSLSDFLPGYLYEGDYRYEEELAGLMLETEYVPYAVGMDFNGGYTTRFKYGQVFATTELPKSDLVFEFGIDARETSVTVDVYPSDKEAWYFTTIIDSSYFGAGLSDEYIMNDIISDYGDDLIFYLHTGDLIGEESTGMIPTTYYYAIAFGVDTETGYYNTGLFKCEFKTEQSVVSDAYAVGTMENYWLIEDLIGYDPDYAALLGSEPLFGALDIEFNDSAVSAVCVVYVGDLSGVDLYELYRSALVQGTLVERGDPARLVYMSYNDPCTICVIGKDAEGYNGEMSLTVVNLTEEGTSHDYGLFDEYFDAYSGSAGMVNAWKVAKP